MGIISSLKSLFSSLFKKKDSVVINETKVQEDINNKSELETYDTPIVSQCEDEKVANNIHEHVEESTDLKEVERIAEVHNSIEDCNEEIIEVVETIEKVKEDIVIDEVDNDSVEIIHKDIDSSNADTEVEEDIAIKVEDSFIENKFNMFRSLCESREIVNVNRISSDIMIEFCKLPGAGVKKVSDTKDKLIDLWESNREYMKFNYNILSINFIFCECEFESFREFCKEKNIENIKQIKEADIDKFKATGIFTKKAFERIIERVELYKDIDYPEIEIKERPMEELKIELTSYWFEKLKNNKISDIASCLSIDTFDTDDIVSDVQDKVSSEFDKEYAEYLIKINNAINIIKKPSEIIDGIEVALKNERLKTILHDRYLNDNTLEEIGQREGITRERVRQLQKKAETLVIGHLSANNFTISLQLEFLGRDMCSINEFNKLFKDEYKYFAPVILSQQGIGITVIESLDAIMFKENSNLEYILSNIVSKLPSLFKTSSYIREIKIALKGIGLENPSLRVIDNILVQNGYKKYGKYYSRDKITIMTACEVIFKAYIDNPIRLDDEGANYIRDLALNHLEIELGDTTRSIEGRIRDSQELILVDRLTFFHIDNLNLSDDVIKSLGEYLRNEFETRDVINVAYLFENNEGYWVTNNINTKYVLYSLIGYYYGEKYKIGVGNSLDVYVDKNATVYTREERLIEIVKQYNGRVEKEVAIDVSGWSTIKIEDTISKSNKLKREGMEIVFVD